MNNRTPTLFIFLAAVYVPLFAQGCGSDGPSNHGDPPTPQPPTEPPPTDDLPQECIPSWYAGGFSTNTDPRRVGLVSWDNEIIERPNFFNDGAVAEFQWNAQHVLRIQKDGQLALSMSMPASVSQLALAAADITNDGDLDLIIVDLWGNRVLAFDLSRGAQQSLADAVVDIAISHDTEGLALWFGMGIAVLDFDRDGSNDLVVGGPGEPEEACVAQEAVRIYAGPFTGQRDGETPTYIIDVPKYPPPVNTLTDPYLAAQCWGIKLVDSGDGRLQISYRLFESIADPPSNEHRWHADIYYFDAASEKPVLAASKSCEDVAP